MAAPHTPPNFRQGSLLAALALAAGSIPLSVNLNSRALILLVFACAIQQPLKITRNKLARPSLWMIPTLYFLWICCSFFWDATGGFAIKDIERYAVLFFIPPALALLPPLPDSYLKATAGTFIVMVTAVSIGCLIKSCHQFQETHDRNVFVYHYLSGQMNLNAIFLSNYCLTGIIWLLYYGFFGEQKRSNIIYAVVVAVSIFLFCMILLLASKLVMFLSVLLITVFVLYISFMKKKFIWGLIVIALFIGGGIAALSKLGYVRWRITETSVKEYSGERDNNNGLSIRMLMWNTPGIFSGSDLCWGMVYGEPG